MYRVNLFLSWTSAAQKLYNLMLAPFHSMIESSMDPLSIMSRGQLQLLKTLQIHCTYLHVRHYVHYRCDWAGYVCSNVTSTTEIGQQVTYYYTI